jgi:hypothetical protein
MAEEVKETPKEEEKKKGPFSKLREAATDHEGQLEAISTMVRLGILIWSGGILTLAYIKLPPALGIPEQKLDPTFIASVFTGPQQHRQHLLRLFVSNKHQFKLPLHLRRTVNHL